MAPLDSAQPAWVSPALLTALFALLALAGLLAFLLLLLRSRRLQHERSLSRFEIAVKASNGVIWDWDCAAGPMSFYGNTAGFIPGVDLGARSWGVADLLESVHPDDKAVVLAATAGIGAPGTAVIEVRLLVAPPPGAGIGSVEDYLKWVRIEGSVVERSKDGRPLRVAGSIVDITKLKLDGAALRLSLRQKDEFLHEIHHRVKNNIQLMLSILNLQEAGIKAPEAVLALKTAKGRLAAIAMIQDEMYDKREGGVAEFAGWLEQIFSRLRLIYSAWGSSITVAPPAFDALIGLKVLQPLALAVNEALVNSIVHAAPDGTPVALRASFALRDEGTLGLLLEDDGRGIPPDAPAGLGIELMRNLIDSAGGRVEFLGGPGTRILIIFPLA